jgi:hypothetical protein
MPANNRLHIIRKSVLLCAVWVLGIAGMMPAASQVKFYTQVNDQHITGAEVLQVQYIIEGAKNIREFRQPAFTDFSVERVIDIPYTSNHDPGDVQPQDTYSKVTILAPRRSGNFNIPGATAIIDGKLMHSNVVAVQVINDQLPVSDAVQPDSLTVIDQSEIRPGETIAKKVRENFFLSAETNKTTCYVGEPMMAVYRACTRLNTSSQVVKRPSFTGFSVIEMVDSYDSRPVVERIHGKPFYVHLIRKVQLFPLQPGTYELDNAEVESTIHFVKRDGTAADELGKLFDPSSNGQYQPITHNLTLKTDPITITVKPLPDTGQPPDFSGAVGNFAINAQTSQATTTTGSQVTVQFLIKGSGNFPLVTAPQVKWPEGLEVSNAVVREKTDPYQFPLTGYKSFEYSIVPRDTGTLVIPSASFSYFDAQHKSYKTVTSPALTIVVKKGSNSIFSSKTEYVFNSRPSIPLHYYWFGLVVMVIAGWIVYQLFFNRTPAAEKVVDVEEPAETRVLSTNDYFGVASLAIINNDQKKFYTEIQRVLWELAAAKSSVMPSELNKRNVTYRLRQASVSEDTIHDLVQIMDECEWLLYTPDAGSQNLEAMLDRAKSIFERLKTA